MKAIGLMLLLCAAATAQNGVIGQRPLVGRILLSGRLVPVYGVAGAASVGDAVAKDVVGAAFGGDVVALIAEDRRSIEVLVGATRSEIGVEEPLVSLKVSANGRWLAATTARELVVWRTTAAGKISKAWSALASSDVLAVGDRGEVVANAGRVELLYEGGAARSIGDDAASAVVVDRGCVVSVRRDGSLDVSRSGELAVLSTAEAGPVVAVLSDGNRVWAERNGELLEVVGAELTCVGALGGWHVVRALGNNVLLATRSRGVGLVDVQGRPATYVLPTMSKEVTR